MVAMIHTGWLPRDCFQRTYCRALRLYPVPVCASPLEKGQDLIGSSGKEISQYTFNNGLI
jgi:hypothetical protein